MVFNNFFAEKYGPFSASLPDIIAAKYSIKPVARLSCTSLAELKRYTAAFEDDGLFIAKKFVRLSKSFFRCENDIIYFYLSRSKALAKEACSIDPEYTTCRCSNKAKTKIKNFAALLGYPACCVDAYVEMGQKKLSLFLMKWEKKSFYLNNFLHGISNYYLSFHLPCSYNCSRSLIHNQNIYGAIKKEFPKFAELLRNNLARPILVRFWKISQETFFDNRGIIIVEGVLKNGILKYHSAVMVMPSYARISVGLQDRYFYRFENFFRRPSAISSKNGHFVFSSKRRKYFELAKKDAYGMWVFFCFSSS